MQNYSQLRSYQEILTSRGGIGFSEAEVREVLYQVLLLLTQWHDQGQAYGLISLETIAQDQVSHQVVLLQGSQFVNFPQSACGDPIPADNGSPISFYPVFVEYSDRNLQQIQSQFCQDALPKIRKGTNRQAVQVASFTSRDRAVLFADFLGKRLKGAEVGEPTILPSLRSSANAVVVSSDRVSFNSGSSSAIVSGDVSPNQKRQYVLNCGNGQQFNASLVQGQANLRLIDPNGSTVASGSNNLNARLSISGDYTIEISSFEQVNFNLRIEIL